MRTVIGQLFIFNLRGTGRMQGPLRGTSSAAFFFSSFWMFAFFGRDDRAQERIGGSVGRIEPILAGRKLGSGTRIGERHWRRSWRRIPGAVSPVALPW